MSARRHKNGINIQLFLRLNSEFLQITLPGSAGTRKAKPIWILLKQETTSGGGISWAICKSALSSRQTTTPAPHHSVFYRPDALPATQPTASKHWRPRLLYYRSFWESSSLFNIQNDLWCKFGISKFVNQNNEVLIIIGYLSWICHKKCNGAWLKRRKKLTTKF